MGRSTPPAGWLVKGDLVVLGWADEVTDAALRTAMALKVTPQLLEVRATAAVPALFRLVGGLENVTGA
jgi:hypothetical protein